MSLLLLSYLHLLICCLLRFLFLGYTLYFLILFLFVRRLGLSSTVVSWSVFRTLIPIFLYGLFVFVSSVSSVLFFFSVLLRLSSSFVLRLSSLLCNPFQSTTSAPLLRPPLGFTVLSLQLSSPERLYSSSWFFLWLLWGLVSVCGLAAAPTVPVVTLPLFCPLRLLCPLLLHFVCSVSSYSLPFLRLLHSRLLLPVFLYFFPRADAPAAPSRLPSCFLHSGFCSYSVCVAFLSLSVPTAFCGDSASFGSPVPFATLSPFGTSQVLLHPLFLSLVRVASGGLFHFYVGFRSVPLTHSHLRFP